MSKHQPRNAVSAPKWCNKCRRQTQHKIWFGKTGGGRIGHCLDCEARQEADHQARAAAKPVKPAAVQTSLFGGGR